MSGFNACTRDMGYNMTCIGLNHIMEENRRGIVDISKLIACFRSL